MMKRNEILPDNGTGEYYRDCQKNYDVDGIRKMAQHVIDVHCHVYSHAIVPKAVRAIERFYGHLPGSHQEGVVRALVEDGRKQGTSGYVIHSVATRPEQVSLINAYFEKWLNKKEYKDELITFGTLHPKSEHLREDFDELIGMGLKGVKIHPDFQQFHVDSPEAIQIFEMCEDAGLPILVHTGDFRYDYSNPSRVVPVLKRFPKLIFIGAHFGGWSVWEEAVRKLSDYPNMWVDTSSSFYWLTPEKATELIRAYGSERVMFGTDYPMWGRLEELEYLRRLDLDADEYEDICWRTCDRIFGLISNNNSSSVR